MAEPPHGPVEAARLAVLLSEASFQAEMSREVRARLEQQVGQLERELAEVKAERSSLRCRLEERENYIQILHGSRGWKALQAVRRLFGRAWW